MKHRIKTAGFWAGLVGALILILGAFGINIGEQAADTAVNSVCSVLVMLGIIVPPPGSKSDNATDVESEDKGLQSDDKAE